MLANRKETSSKYYPEVPSVVAKSLVRKYQRNRKCKKVRRVVIPICGDKGRQVKMEGGGIRLPSITQKEIITIRFLREPIGFILNVEFFRRSKEWFVSVQYRVKKAAKQSFSHLLGIDRNVKGNVAVAACISLAGDTTNGKVKMLGPDASGIKETFRNRRAKLQRKNKKKALKKLSGKQLRCFCDINHKVSRNIVNFAEETSSAIVLEDLGSINKGKAARYAKRSQWAFFELLTFGIPVFTVNPAYTSQICSKCGTINKTSTKKYSCECGHIGHRDVNAAFNIAQRCKKALIELCSDLASNVGRVGLPGDPLKLVAS